jgi:NAD(P)-dependent dehydrogenase (short-subunit alcohol dehydrogenase family)
MNTELAGRTALVTGATSGIGRAVATRLAAMGAHVIVSGRDHVRGDKAVAELRGTGARADFVAADLADLAEVRRLARDAEAVTGSVDILVNNAGFAPLGPTADILPETFEQVYAINVRAPFYLVGALAPKMAERGHGAVVNISTMAAGFGMVGLSLYGSSKAALELLTKNWAAEFGPHGVRVNAVSPGPTRTEGTESWGENLDLTAAAAPAGRVADPEEIAAAVAFLASDQASFVHGSILPVDGGRVAV